MLKRINIQLKSDLFRIIDFIFDNKRCRRLILIFGDLLIIPISIFLSLYIKYDSFLYDYFNYFKLSIIFIVVGFPVYLIFGQYKSLSSYFGTKIIFNSFLRNTFISILTIIVGSYLFIIKPSFQLIIIIIFNITIFNLIFRYIIRKILISYSKSYKDSETKIAIYGAGISGVNLANSLNLLGTYRIITFFDHNKDL